MVQSGKEPLSNHALCSPSGELRRVWLHVVRDRSSTTEFDFRPANSTFARLGRIMRFIDEVIGWYQENKRDLPWRNTQDPYLIWLSEIILQQTRVDQGMPYFFRFSERYPTVADFAAACEDDILNMWQGLGYYSRGRNMHRTARMVMEEHAGYFPRQYDELIKLKGIGEYTAAAISSFSSNEVKAVVDGNVFRLLSRYFGIDEAINSTQGKKTFYLLANETIDRNRPGLSNQALMEFGALQCKPANPDCNTCPLRPGCFAFNKNLITRFPVKLKKAGIRDRFFNYIVAFGDQGVVMNKRTAKDIWQNLHEFPLFETEGPVDPSELICRDDLKVLFGTQVQIQYVYGPVKHLLSHQRLHAQFIVIKGSDDSFKNKKPWFHASYEQLKHLAQPKLIFAFLEMFPTLKSDLHSY